ncbi:MAG: hypothetical protein K2P58_13905 [Hyphomonadaceae bacterium]|nr:hypothetical protein [Hyphomonadaceae bacterium]
MATRRLFVWGGLGLITGCASRDLLDASGLVGRSDVSSDWRQYPCVARYRRGHIELTFVGARHDADENGQTQRLVREAFAEARPRLVIVEGFSSNDGLSPVDALRNAQRGESAWAKGEAGLAIRLAAAAQTPFMGGDASQKQVYDILLAQGYTTDELFGGLVLRATIQSLTAGQLDSPADPRFTHLFNAVLQMVRSEQSLDLDPNYGVEDFYAWHHAAFGVSFAHDADLVRRAAPDTETRIGRMNIAWNQPRDIHLFHTIREKLNEYGRVLVVFGGGHLSALSPALSQMLGPPTGACGVGGP